MLNDINPYLSKLYLNGKKKYINPQPGHYCGMTKKVNKDETTCHGLKKRVLCDNKHIFEINRNQKCPPNFYKGALTVNPKKQYHFYRQDQSGYWSHKDGGRAATNLDASGKLILDPQCADRNHSKENKESDFKQFCNYFCIPKNEYKKTSASRRKHILPHNLLYKI